MMKSAITRRTSCRLCENENLTLVLPIHATPIADGFITKEELHEKQPRFPLDLYQCQSCGHAQNVDIVNPDLLFRDYLFNTSNSSGLVEHFRQYAKDIVEKFQIPTGSLIVEIGSNDGTLLAFFKELGMTVVGIDPALEIANRATQLGIPTYPDFFTSTLAAEIKQKYGHAKLVVANNVYAHSDQLADMTDAIASLLNDDGVFVFEVSYLLDIIDKFLFDTIYHEHVSYHSVDPFKKFFALHGLQLFDINRVSTKGGSMRGFVQKKNGPRQEEAIIAEMINEESHRGLHRPDIFKMYEQEILQRKKAVQKLVDQAMKENKKVVGFGASTTAMTLMYHFELADKLAYLIDDNQKKHGLFAPDCHLEVKPSSVLYTDKPDVVIVLAWQYAGVIYKKQQKFVDDGGIFVVPLINLEVIDQSVAS
jgi:hypothetical protein